MIALVAQAASVWQVLFAGGWPGMVILGLLALLSLAAMALVVELSVTLRRAALVPEGLATQVAKRLAEGDASEALALCQRQPSALASVVESGLVEAQSSADWGATEGALESTTHAHAARLLRRADYLSVVGNLAPMLGLLGTVVGMIFAFREVAATQGAATAGELASGIYQALVTTVGGLIVAIPSLAAYAVLRNRIDDRFAEVLDLSATALQPLKQAFASRR